VHARRHEPTRRRDARALRDDVARDASDRRHPSRVRGTSSSRRAARALHPRQAAGATSSPRRMDARPTSNRRRRPSPTAHASTSIVCSERAISQTRDVGIIRCDRHGLQGLGFVSPSVAGFVSANATFSRDDIANIRYVAFEDDYPPGRAWVEPSIARAIGDRVILVEDVASLELDAVCCECLDVWRFLCIQTQLNDLLRPRLEPVLQAIGHSVFEKFREPSEYPFRAYAGATDRRVLIELHDRRDALHAIARSSLFDATPPSELQKLASWAEQVAAWPERGLASFNSADRSPA
jgi:hypothetical protein